LIDRTLRRALPALGDFGFVHVRTGEDIKGVAAAHSRAEQTRLVRALLRAHRLHLGDHDSAVAHVIRTGRPLVRMDIQPESNGRGRISDLHRQLAPRSALVVPIIVRDRVLGALSLCYSQSARRYTQASLARAGRLALQIGYILMMATDTHGLRLPAAARDTRQGTTLRRRVAARN
jgi:GAF domain-containing protein